MADPVDYVFNHRDMEVVVRRWDWLPTAEDPRLDGARMRLEVVSASGIPREMFVWERHTIFTNGTAENKDRTMCVAKASDFNVYPIDDPDTGSDIPPFYRSYIFDNVFSSPEDLISTWNNISNDILNLMAVYYSLGLSDAYSS